MCKRNSGFSLVEMAIVLIIFGLVLASASSILTLFVNKGGTERTRKMLEADKNALFSIAGSEGYLQTADTGDKKADVSLTYPQDAYGKNIVYFLDPTVGYTDTRDAMDYSPVCGTKSTKTTLRICSDVSCSSYKDVDNVAFVLVSGGANKNIQTADSSDLVTVYYQGADVTDPYTAEGINRNEKYDDVVDWVTLPELRAKAGCDAEKLSLMNSSTPVMHNGQPYTYVIYAKGGVPYADQSPGSSYEWHVDSVETEGGVSIFYPDSGSDTDDEGVSVDLNLFDGYNDIFYSGNESVKSPYLKITGTPSGVTPGVYLLKLSVSDDSFGVSGKYNEDGEPDNNKLERTIYLQVQD